MRKLLTVLVSLIVLASAHANLTFTINYTQDSLNFFNTQAKKDSMQAAANYVASLVSNTALSAITPGGMNTWSTIISNPGTGGLTTFTNPSIAANNIVIYAGGRNLGGSVLGLAGPAGFSATGTLSFLNSIQFRGNGTFRMTSVGSVAFSTTFAFYFDDDFTTIESGAMAGKADFFSIATHEIGHILGIGTNASWDALATGSHTFIGDASTAANGGTPPSLTTDDGHWITGTTSTVFGTSTLQDTLMSPTISLGQRKYVTTLDLAGLSDIGFAAVPEPAHVALGAGIVVFALGIYFRRRRAA